jgi:hypothetical protein
MKRKSLTPVDHADAYRAYSAAIRLVSKLPIADLKMKSRIVSYLYEAGHVHWIALSKLDCSEFGRAFDISRGRKAA